MRSYSDAELAQAVAASGSWRGVLRALGLRGTSAGAMRSVRTQADRLGLSYAHFRGQRRWTDRQLASAVLRAKTWTEVALDLGLAGSSATRTLQGHAVRLSLPTNHLEPGPTVARSLHHEAPRRSHLSRAGALMAAAWFELCGRSVSWPLEPARYDLLVWRGDGADRVQVKTTTVRDGATWQVRLSTTRKETHTYGPDEIDQFFVIDGDYRYYLIPVAVVGGLTAINVSAYQDFLLPQLGATAPATPC